MGVVPPQYWDRSFVYMYFLRLGFLDGRPGYIYAVLKAAHEFHINAKMWEMREMRERTICERP